MCVCLLLFLFLSLLHCVHTGIDYTKVSCISNVSWYSTVVMSRFDKIQQKTQSALASAETANSVVNVESLVLVGFKSL